jgi:hypothetical protein
MIPWFRDFYKVMQDSGLELRWTALGVVDADIASARSVIEWGGELQNTVDYVIRDAQKSLAAVTTDFRVKLGGAWGQLLWGCIGGGVLAGGSKRNI